MNRIVSTFVLCFAACSVAACGTTTNTGGGTVQTDVQNTADTGTIADTGAMEDMTMGTDASATDTKTGTDAASADTAAPDIAADTGPQDTGTTTDISAPDDTAAAGACTNAADKTILDSGKVQDATTNCAMQSMGDATKAAACVQKATGLSDGCSTCFAGILSCTFKNCLTNCMGGQTPACSQCMADKGCNATFTDCAGVSP